MKTAYGLPRKREEVANELQVAFAEGNLDEVEYEKRLGEVYEAVSLEELQEVIADFPTPIQAKLFPSKRATNNHIGQGKHYQTTTANQPPPPMHPHGRHADRMRVIMGEQRYQVAKLGERPVSASVFLGGLELDANQAVLDTSTCSIFVECFLGNAVINLLNPELEGKHVDLYINGALAEVTIIIPFGVHVSRPLRLYLGEFSFKQKTGKDFLGLFRTKKQEPVPPVPFTLAIHGEFFLGSIGVVQRQI